MFLCNLLSSSSGNATLLSSEKNHFLIDAGIPPAEIERLLEPFDLSYDRLSGIVITHLHQDHFHPTNIKMLLKLPVKLIVHTSHLEPLNRKRKAFARLFQTGRVITYNEQKRFYIEDNISFFPIGVPHDTFELGKTFGFIFDIIYRSERKKLSFFSDLGNMPHHTLPWLLNSDILALEHNYDDDMLWGSTRSRRLKQRISGDLGHLSNEMANKIIRTCLALSDNPMRHILLLHLSKECNNPDLPRLMVYNALQEFETAENTRIHTASSEKSSMVLNFF